MAGTTRKWLVGCGIGCGLFVLALGAVGTCGYFAVRRIVDKAEDLDDGFAALAEGFGAPEDFVPPPDGCIPPGRVEAFLAVREKLAPLRAEVAAQFRVLDGEGAGNVLAKIRAAAGVVPSVLGFIGERNRALLEGGMGVGEYQHIYCLAYYGLLGKDPADGPGFALADDRDEDGDGPQVRWTGRFGDRDDPQEVRERRAQEVRRRVNRVQRAVIANQSAALAAVPAGDPAGIASGSGAGGGRQEADDDWRSRLEAEARAMRDESLRLPWDEGLPERIAECLKPFGDRLDAAYEPLTAILDVGLTDDEGHESRESREDLKDD